LTQERHLIANISTTDYSGIHPVELIRETSDDLKIWNLLESPLKLNDTMTTKLSRMFEIKSSPVEFEILRNNREYILNVYYKFVGSPDQRSFNRDQLIKNLSDKLPLGYRIYNPQPEYLNTGQNTHKTIIMAAVLLLSIYLTVAALFESLIFPFLILLLIPIAFIGIFIMFYYNNITFRREVIQVVIFALTLFISQIFIVFNIYKAFCKRRPRSIAMNWFRAASIALHLNLKTGGVILIVYFVGKIIHQNDSFGRLLINAILGEMLVSSLSMFLLLPAMVFNRIEKTKYLVSEILSGI
jgi:hypothetical protein